MDAAGKVALVADDDEFFRIALRTILKNDVGFAEVVETGSLDEAINELSERGEKVSLALFDLAMPGMKCPGSLKALREFYPGIKMAIVSSSMKRADILAALEAGLHGYVPKGLGASELTSALSQIASGSIFVPPLIAAHEAVAASADEEGKTMPDVDKSVLELLTPRQIEVLKLLARGKSTKEIANELHLGAGTVKIHLGALFKNLGVKNRSAAAVLGAQLLGYGN